MIVGYAGNLPRAKEQS